MGECPTGKLTYANPQRAWRAARIIARRVRKTARDRRLPGPVTAYRCRMCSGWHTTSAAERSTKGRYYW